MHVKATIKGKALASQVQIPVRAWQDLGNRMRLRIIMRTRGRGVDADGAPFEPYSPGYAKTKAKRGGMIGGGRVNLTGVTAGPKMLDDIAVLQVSATNNPRLILGFATAGKATIARYHMGEGRVDREFFALSDDDMDDAHSYLRAQIART